MLRRALPTATFALTLPAAAYAERRHVHVLTASHSSRVAAADFAREVEGKTAGRVTVQPFLSGQRGAEPAPLAFSELFFAVPQGVFDTQETPRAIIWSVRIVRCRSTRASPAWLSPCRAPRALG